MIDIVGEVGRWATQEEIEEYLNRDEEKEEHHEI